MDDLSNVGIDALFDFTFTRFITVTMVKWVYILGMLVIVLEWFGGVISTFAGAGALAGIGAMIVLAILALVQVLMLRISLELVVVIFRIGDNTSYLARGGAPAQQGFPVSPMPEAPPIITPPPAM